MWADIWDYIVSRRYPDVSLELVELYATEQPGAIARGAVDLVLGAGPFRTDTEDIPVAYEELLVSLPAANPLADQLFWEAGGCI